MQRVFLVLNRDGVVEAYQLEVEDSIYRLMMSNHGLRVGRDNVEPEYVKYLKSLPVKSRVYRQGTNTSKITVTGKLIVNGME